MFLWDIIFQCYLGLTYYGRQAGWPVRRRDPLVSVSSVLGLQACTTMPAFFFFLI